MLNFFWIIPYMIFMLLAVLISLAYSILMYVLNGMGVSRMAKSLGVSNPNGAFVPFYRMKILGDVAEESAVRNNGKRRSYGNILMWLYRRNRAFCHTVRRSRRYFEHCRG